MYDVYFSAMYASQDRQPGAMATWIFKHVSCPGHIMLKAIARLIKLPRNLPECHAIRRSDAFVLAIRRDVCLQNFWRLETLSGSLTCCFDFALGAVSVCSELREEPKSVQCTNRAQLKLRRTVALIPMMMSAERIPFKVLTRACGQLAAMHGAELETFIFKGR